MSSFFFVHCRWFDGGVLPPQMFVFMFVVVPYRNPQEEFFFSYLKKSSGWMLVLLHPSKPKKNKPRQTLSCHRRKPVGRTFLIRPLKAQKTRRGAIHPRQYRVRMYVVAYVSSTNMRAVFFFLRLIHFADAKVRSATRCTAQLLFRMS